MMTEPGESNSTPVEFRPGAGPALDQETLRGLASHGNDEDPADRLFAELMDRWQAGQRPPAEAFLSRHPSLPPDGEAAFELVYSEYLVRESLGDAPDVEEFAWRFPQFSGRFNRQLELHRALGMPDPPTHFDRPGSEPDLEEPGSNLERFPVVAGYRIRRELGRGAVGVVFEALQQGLNRLVALKVIRSWVFSDPGVAARFRAEAETAARLTHPNIIQVYEVGEHDGEGFLALEYAPGGSLQQRIAAAPQDPRESARLVETSHCAFTTPTSMASCTGI